jgi:hypothetical protein
MALFSLHGALFLLCCARRLFSGARELSSVLFLFFLYSSYKCLNTRNFTISFDHLAWNITSTSFDLNVDPPKSECSLILYSSYEYLFLIIVLNRF